MKQELFKLEFKKIFKWLINEANVTDNTELELDQYKLWNFILAGDSYYFVFNHHSFQCDIVSREVEDIIGYKQSEFNLPFMCERIHPDDLAYFIAFGNKIIDFYSQLKLEQLMKYKLRYDVRYRKKNGEYARLLYQGIITKHDEVGGIVKSLGIHTDISYIKKESKPVLSFLGIGNEPSYIDVDPQINFKHSKQNLTTREKEVLHLLIEGKLSKQISDILHITKQTVDTHRKNMLHKNNLNNSNELVSKAIINGWI